MVNPEFTELTPGKAFRIGLNSNKNKPYAIYFSLENTLRIGANINDLLIENFFTGEFTFEKIRENKYFLQFDSLKEIFDELKEKIKNNQISLEENENGLKLNILLPSSKYKEINFELKLKIKSYEEKINELDYTTVTHGEDILVMKLKIKDLKNKDTQLKNEVVELKKELSLLK